VFKWQGMVVLVTQGVDHEVVAEDPVQDLEVEADADQDLDLGALDLDLVQDVIAVAHEADLEAVIEEMSVQGLKALVKRKKIVHLRVVPGAGAETKMEKEIEIAKVLVEVNPVAEVGVQVPKRITTPVEK